MRDLKGPRKMRGWRLMSRSNGFTEMEQRLLDLQLDGHICGIGLI